MKITQIIATILFSFFFAPTFAQMKKGHYYAYEIKKGQKIPEVITIEVLDNDKFCRKFFNSKTKKQLEGTFFISENRQSFYVGVLSNGRPDGNWEHHYKEALYKKMTYVNGKLDGKHYTYSNEGDILSEIAYKEGVMQHRIDRYENGQLRSECFYDENGKRHGRSVEYNDKGEIVKDENYVHGEIDE